MKKYELTDESMRLSDGPVLHRIRATMDFYLVDGTKVKTGDLGGWIESESNLSQNGGAWIGYNAIVSGNAWVYGNAWVFGNARVFGRVRIFGNARVYDNVIVFGNSKVFGNAWVFGNANVYDYAFVYGNSLVFGNAKVFGNARVHDSALVHGIVSVSDHADICGDPEVKKGSDYFVAKNVWSSFRWFTYTRSNKKWKVGCFYGTGEELITKAYKDSKKSGRCYEAIVRAQEAIYNAIDG